MHMSENTAESINSLISNTVLTVLKSCFIELESKLAEAHRKECNLIRQQMSEMESRIRSEIARRHGRRYSSTTDCQGSATDDYLETNSEECRSRYGRGKLPSPKSLNGVSGHTSGRSQTTVAARSEGQGHGNRRAAVMAHSSVVDLSTSPVQRQLALPSSPADTVFVSFERRWGRVVYSKQRASSLLDDGNHSDGGRSPHRNDSSGPAASDDAASAMLFHHERDAKGAAARGARDDSRGGGGGGGGQRRARDLSGANGGSNHSPLASGAEHAKSVPKAPAAPGGDEGGVEGGEEGKDSPARAGGRARERAVSFHGETHRAQMSHRDSLGGRESTGSQLRSTEMSSGRGCVPPRTGSTPHQSSPRGPPP